MEDQNSEAKQSTTSNVFRFFDLPPELRDLVYEQLLGEEKCIFEPEHEATLAVKHYPLVEMQLVSEQLRNEYLKQIGRRATAIFGDHIEFDFSLPSVMSLSKIQKVEMRMFVTCQDMCPLDHQHCDASRDLRQTIGLTKKILEVLPQVISLEAHLGIWWQSSRAHTWPDTPHNDELIKTLDELVAVERVTRVNVYRAREACLDTSILIDKTKWFAVWTPANSWQSVQKLEPEVERIEEEDTAGDLQSNAHGPLQSSLQNAVHDMTQPVTEDQPPEILYAEVDQNFISGPARAPDEASHTVAVAST